MSVTRSYYRGAAGALLVYDITSRETYNALTNWLTDARMLASQSIVILLCGNKKDLDTDREVTFLEASRFAQENELMFLETSALTGENVEEAFVQCARKILNRIESEVDLMGTLLQLAETAQEPRNKPDVRDDTGRCVRACDFPVPCPPPCPRAHALCCVGPVHLPSMFLECDRIGMVL
ncbi:ras-related protein Rab-4A isoform 3-T5 [Callospermophilus lateralis]|uniref:ras-related protein Rab-4A isoform X3 n=1 Tax=Callospermophilus lateralis TaxID=76772 RepID=UPI0040388698